jgi:putative hemolysin
MIVEGKWRAQAHGFHSKLVVLCLWIGKVEQCWRAAMYSRPGCQTGKACVQQYAAHAFLFVVGHAQALRPTGCQSVAGHCQCEAEQLLWYLVVDSLHGTQLAITDAGSNVHCQLRRC